MTNVMFSCRKLPEKFGKLLSEDQLQQIEELGLLADLDDQVRLVPNTRVACSSACHRLHFCPLEPSSSTRCQTLSFSRTLGMLGS